MSNIDTTEPDWLTVDYDETWSDLWKLSFRAAHAGAKIGLPLTVQLASLPDADEEQFGIYCATPLKMVQDGDRSYPLDSAFVAMAYTFEEVWAVLDGIRFGVKLARYFAELTT
jgi:hypothetical protein